MQGEDLSSTAMSPHARCLEGSNESCDGTVISLKRKNPKKQRLAAAQSMIIVYLCKHWSVLISFQQLCNGCKIAGVIGRRILS